MIVTVLSIALAVLCAVASGLRLVWAVGLTSLDPALLTDALADGRFDVDALRDRVERSARVDRAFAWERDLLEAFTIADPRARDAAVDEQLSELDGRAQRWARVPGVCARVAASGAFLFAVAALASALTEPSDDATRGVHLAFSVVDSITVGCAGAAFCVAIHFRARRLVRERLAAIDRLVARMYARVDAGPERTEPSAGGAPTPVRSMQAT